jgi:hypothetical protein
MIDAKILHKKAPEYFQKLVAADNLLLPLFVRMLTQKKPLFVRQNPSLAYYWSILHNDRRHSCRYCNRVIFKGSQLTAHEMDCQTKPK